MAFDDRSGGVFSERAARTPMISVPAVVVVLALAIAACSVALLAAPAALQAKLLAQFALWPLLAKAALHGRDVVSGLAVPLFSHAFLHESLRHLGSNLLWLVVFGAPVARSFSAATSGDTWRGGFFFAAFFFASVAVAGATQLAFSRDLGGYLLGASGGDFGLFGAVLRFGFRAQAEQGRPPLLFAPLTSRRVLTAAATIAALEVLFSGVLSKLGLGPSNIAWQAHLGGFAFGLIAFPAFWHAAARR